MAYYNPPLREMKFVLEAMGYNEEITSLDAYKDYDLETGMMVDQTTADIAVKELLSLNKTGDEEGVKFNPETGEVTTPKGFREAYQTLFQAGLIGVTGPVEYGGGGAPEPLGILFSEIVTASNKSFSMCPGLTRGLVDALEDHGSEEEKEKYLPKLVTGEWTGTMCLTEPQCGTDLGLLTTKAEPQEDGSYKLSGTKIWITFGEHDLADNIIHLVLARLPDAPEGTRGISTFIVPKYLDDGTKNAIACTGLEHKMGIHASPTCVMTMEGATGWLVGEPNKGMRAMFTMMNVARLYVGIEGVALGEIAYQTALAFAKDRRQGRSLNEERNDENASADNILVHPDVRRLMLNQKSTTEALRALGIWLGIEQALSVHHPDEERRKQADDMVALLTPIIKSYGTERGFQNISDAMQVCGGSGYTTDWDIEQYMRDERIAMIYEGTNHIQSLDLIGRKLPRGGGRLIMGFQQRVNELTEQLEGNDVYAPFLEQFQKGANRLMQATMGLMENGAGDPEWAASIASNYLNLFAQVALGFVWLKQIHYAVENDHPLKDTKLKTARYFFEYIYPETGYYAKLCQTDKDTIMGFDVEEF
jgi:alkylation response protein AidB-like acyl-CoA dehydrogenase